MNSTYDDILKLVCLDLKEAIAAERMYSNLSYRESLREFGKTEEGKGIATIQRALGTNFMIALQRLFQGDNKATLRQLLKIARRENPGKDFQEFDKWLKTIRKSDSAVKLKDIRNSVLAHNDLKSISVRGKKINMTLFTDLLYESEEYKGVVISIVRLNTAIKGIDESNEIWGTHYDNYCNISSKTWDFLLNDVSKAA